MRPLRIAAVILLHVVAVAGCNNGCNPNPCSTPLPPSPPIGSNCHTTGYTLALSAFPDTGDLQPDYLVPSGTTVDASALAFEEYDCLETDGTTSHGVRRPDFRFDLQFVPRGGAKMEASNQLHPQSMCLSPTFVATRGTWRLTLSVTQHPDVARTITIEAADPDEWVHIGPDGRVDCHGDSCMGRMSGITFDPNRPGFMFAAAPRGGIFRSDDSGSWWYPMSDHKIVDGNAKEWGGGLSTTRIVALPNSHLVAATCDTDWFGLGLNGCDNGHLFYRSSDLGVTWTQNQTGCTDPNEQDVPAGPVMDLIVDSSTSTLYTVAGGSIYRSKSEGNCWRRINPPGTLLNGLSLTAATVQSLSYIDVTRHFLYVAASPFDSSTEQSLNQVLFDTSDAEALDPPWTAAAVDPSAQGSLNTKGQSFVARIQLASGAGSVYALVPVAPVDPNAGYSPRLFRGTVTGTGLPTFVRTKADPPTLCGSQCNWYDLALAVNDNAPAFVNEVAVAGIQFVVHSVTGGDSWNNIGQAHVDHHFLAFDPSGTRLWSSSDGGLAVIDLPPNGSWLDRNYGLNTSLVYRASISATDPTHSLTGIGLQDNGNFARKMRGRVWDRISGCDGFQISFDASDPLISYEGPDNCNRALNHIDLRNNDEHNLGRADLFQADRYRSGRLFGIDKMGTPNEQLYVADNLKNQIAPPIAWRCADPQPTLAGESVTSILTLPGDLDRPLVGNGAGDIWRTDLTKLAGNAVCGATDTAGVAIYSTQPAPKAAIIDIALDPQDQSSLYVTQARNDPQHVVHLVYDAQSATWSPTALGQNLPATSLASSTNGIAADPKSPATLYLGTDVGLLKGGSAPSSAWTTVASVPNTMVADVMTAEGVNCDAQGIVRVATFGRGVYERFFATGTATPACASGASARRSNPLRLHPDGADGFFRPAPAARLQIEYDAPEGAAELRVSALRGQTRVPEIPIATAAVKDRRGRHIVTLALAANATGLVESDTVVAELVGRDGKVLASTKESLRIQLRGSKEFTLRLTTSLVSAGGSLPLTKIELSLGAKKVVTPTLLALPRHRGVVLDVPAVVTLPDGRRATFAGWFGTTQAVSDWTRRNAIAGSSMSRHLEFVLDGETSIDVRYRPPFIENERGPVIKYPRR
jgi:hypothetical protein